MTETATVRYKMITEDQKKKWIPFCKRCSLRKRDCKCTDQELDHFILGIENDC
jgi:hypothetical protein